MNSLPEVLPILNSNEPKTVHRDVSFWTRVLPKLLLYYGATSCVFEGGGLVICIFKSISVSSKLFNICKVCLRLVSQLDSEY